MLFASFGPTSVKKELNLLAISFSSFMISSPSLKKGGSDLLLLFLDKISLVVFDIFLMSYFEFMKDAL